MLLGGLLGLVAGYRRGTTDRVVGIVTDALLSLPAIVLAIVMIVKLDTVKEAQTWLGWLDRRWQITFTLGILAIAPLSRIVRARTLALREADYVLAARSLGASSRWVIGREVLPNLVPTMLTVAFTGLGLLVAAEAALAFLGLSVEAPTPTWGKLIDQNRNAMSQGWWATVFPCLMLFLTVLSFNLIGDWLARRFDIRGLRSDERASRVPRCSRSSISSPSSEPRAGSCGPSTRCPCPCSAVRRSASSASRGRGRPCSAARSWACCRVPRSFGPARSASTDASSSGAPTPSCAACGERAWRWCSRTRRAR